MVLIEKCKDMVLIINESKTNVITQDPQSNGISYKEVKILKSETL